jgi:hypothetical protein
MIPMAPRGGSGSGSGWQTLLADLSLILFMITAAAMAQGGAEPAVSKVVTVPPAVVTPPPRPDSAKSDPEGAPQAIWRASADGPGLGAWLMSSAPDRRLRLTIRAGYRDARDLGRVQARLGVLAAEALRAGKPARLDLIHGNAAVVATLAYDDPAQSVRLAR